MEEKIAMAIILIGMFTMIATIVAVVSRSRSRSKFYESQAQMQNRLVEKFGSAPELASFLQTEGGRRLLSTLATPEAPNPMRRILAAVQAGIVLFVLGVAFLVLDQIFPHDRPGFRIVGTIILALGIGFEASAFAAYRLCRAWGIGVTQERKG